MNRVLRLAASKFTPIPERLGALPSALCIAWIGIVGCASASATGPKPAGEAAATSPHGATAATKSDGSPGKVPSLGWKLLQEGRFDEARRVFEEELKKEPGSIVTARGLAEAYRRSGDLEQAAVALRQTAAMDPSNAEVHVALSEVYGEMKRYQPAADESMEAMERDVPPEVGMILKYNMACYEAQLGNQRTALWWLRQALEAGFNDYDHLQSDPDLESLRKTAAYRELLSP